MSSDRRGERAVSWWHDEAPAFVKGTSHGIELEFEAVPAATIDAIMGWPRGTAMWQDHQIRTIISVLGDGVRDAAYEAIVAVRRQVLPRPLGHLLWFDRVFGVRYSWPSCLVWVPVETAAVLAAPLEPIDIDAVRVHVRRRQNRDWQLALPDVESLGFKVPPLDGIDWRVPQLGYALPTPAELESALEGFTFHVTEPEGDMGDRFTAQLDRLRQLGYDV